MRNLPVGKRNGVGDRKHYCFNCNVHRELVEDALARACRSNTPATTDQLHNNKCFEPPSIWVHAVKWVRDDKIVQSMLQNPQKANVTHGKNVWSPFFNFLGSLFDKFI